MKNRLLDQLQVAEYLGVEPSVLEVYRQKGVGPRFLRISRKCIRYRPEDVEDWLQSVTIDTRAA